MLIIPNYNTFGSRRVNGGGGSSFDNTYSLAFDGIDDKLSVTESTYSGEFTFSFWAKPEIHSNFVFGLSSSNSYFIWLVSATEIRIKLKTVGGGATQVIFTESGGNNIVLDEWQQIIITRDSSNNLNCYRNGTAFGSSGNNNKDFIFDSIGGGINFNTWDFRGNLDEVAVWNSDQSSNIGSIYSSSGAVDLSSLNPTLWLRNGDNGSYKSPQWLIPNNSNKDKVSNYSFSFDGVDDYIDCGTSLGDSQGIITAFSVSMWIKPSVTSGNDLFFNIGSFSNSFGQIAFQLLSNKLYVKLNNGTRNYNIAYTNTTAWQHLVFVYDGSNSANTKMYLNNVEQSPTVSGVFPSTLDLTGLKTIIGAGYSVNYPYVGLLDEVSYFNTTLSSSDVQAIYNNGIPNDISSYSPVGYWKLGEEANFTDNWLVNNSALSNYSTRSFNFDGVDDYIETTKTAALTTASLSMWVKVSGNFGVNERQSLASNDDFNHGRDFIIADTPTTTNDAYIAMFAGAIIYGKTSATGGIPINDGNWHHLVWTYDGSAGTSAAINMYVDGQNQYSNSTYSSFWSYEIKFQYFGKPVAANTYFDGSMDEVAYFNSILSESDVTSIYNSGVPADLSSYSPISWWRMGEDATFSTNWSLPDNGSASNTGTSANMTIADLEGEAPNYTSGGLSANMTIEDRVGEAPNSTSNALSYNMTESDRETDVPT